jgi:hypothetical protein
MLIRLLNIRDHIAGKLTNAHDAMVLQIGIRQATIAVSQSALLVIDSQLLTSPSKPDNKHASILAGRDLSDLACYRVR